MTTLTGVAVPAQGAGWFTWGVTADVVLRGLEDTCITAANFGVTTASSDCTAALAALATTHKSLTQRTIIDLPHGIIKGRLPMAEGIIWRGNGTTVRFPATPTGHLIYPLAAAWLDATDGSGCHRAGLIGDLTFDGEADTWGINPAPIGPTITTGATTGSLATDDYGYQIAYKTTFGIGEPGPVAIRYGASGGITLTWTNTSATAQIVVYGRDPYQAYNRHIMATLAAGTTTWTDNGSITPTGPYAGRGDLSAPSCLITGAAISISGDIKIQNMPGSGLVSKWLAQATIGESWYAQMEARVTGLRIENVGSHGVLWAGPHDSVLSQVVVSAVGMRASENKSGIILDDWGPVRLQQSHVWGDSRYALEVHAPAEVIDCQLEGAKVAQVWANHMDLQLIGGDIFSPQSATAAGIVVGFSGYQPSPTIVGTHLRLFSSSSGPAVNLTYAGAGTRVHGRVSQDTGTVITGSVAGLDVDLIVIGSASAQSVRPQGTTVVASADTSNSTVTAADVTGLAIPAGIVAGTYKVTGTVLLASAATTTGAQVQITAASGVTPALRWTVPNTATADFIAYDRTGAGVVAATAHPYAAGNPVPAFLSGTLVVASTTTTACQVRIQSEIASSAVTAKAGSHLTWQRIA